MWVPATSCTSAACLKHASFGADDSITFTGSQKSWEISYGSGTVSGHIVQDYMTLGSIRTTLPVSFGTADVVAPAFAGFPVSAQNFP